MDQLFGLAKLVHHNVFLLHEFLPTLTRFEWMDFIDELAPFLTIENSTLHLSMVAKVHLPTALALLIAHLTTDSESVNPLPRMVDKLLLSNSVSDHTVFCGLLWFDCESKLILQQLGDGEGEAKDFFADHDDIHPTPPVAAHIRLDLKNIRLDAKLVWNVVFHSKMSFLNVICVHYAKYTFLNLRRKFQIYEE